MALEMVGLLRDLGIFGIGAAVLAFVLRGLFTQMLSRDLEKFKIEIQASHDKEIEGLRADLRAVAFEHEIRFARLHERRAEVIAELYARLVETENAFESLTFPVPLVVGRGEPYDMLSEALRCASTLRNCFYENRIYFDENLCAEIDGFMQNLYRALRHPWLHGAFKDEDFGAGAEERKKTAEEARKIVNEYMPRILSQIEKSFREMLGVR